MLNRNLDVSVDSEGKKKEEEEEEEKEEEEICSYI